MPNLEMLNDTEVEREELEGEGNQTYEDEEHEMVNGDAHTPGMRNDKGRHNRDDDEESDDKQDLNDDQNQAAHEDMEGEGDDQKLESGEDIEDIVIKPEDLEIIAVLYDSIRGLRRRIDEENDKNLADDFDRHLKNVMTELKESITTDDPSHIKNANLLKAKFSLYEICFTKAVEYLKAMDEDVGEVFERIQEGQNSIFGNCYELIRNSGGNDAEAIRNQLIEKENEATEVIETANALNKRFEKEMKEKESLKRNFEREKLNLNKQIESLERENKKLLDTLIRHSKGENIDTIK